MLDEQAWIRGVPRAALALLAFLALFAPARRASADDRYSRFYWREAVGAGFFTAQSSYDNERTRTALGLTFDVASTMGARLAESFAIGGSLDLMPMPPLNVSEAQARGSRDMTASFGWAGLIGPSATFMPGRLRIDLSPGFFWCVTGAAEGEGSGATLGGFGGGVGASVAYDIPLGQRLALGFEGRLIGAAYVNGDPTHHIGWSLTPTALVGLRSR